MNTVANIEPRIQKITIHEDTITAQLEDGRIISVPLAWSWRLSGATKKQRNNYILIGEGIGVHWPDVDEDISAQGMLTGFPAKQPNTLKEKDGLNYLASILQVSIPIKGLPTICQRTASALCLFYLRL